jgi:hypothetical protein
VGSLHFARSVSSFLGSFGALRSSSRLLFALFFVVNSINVRFLIPFDVVSCLVCHFQAVWFLSDCVTNESFDQDNVDPCPRQPFQVESKIRVRQNLSHKLDELACQPFLRCAHAYTWMSGVPRIWKVYELSAVLIFGMFFCHLHVHTTHTSGVLFI